MKRYYPFLALFIFVCSVSACSKKENSTQVIKPAVIVDSTKHTDSVKNVPTPTPISYPQREQFRGKMTNSFNYINDSDNAFIFEVVQLTADSLIVTCSQDVIISYRNTINDDGTMTITGKVTGRNYHNCSGANFKITGDSLYVSWSFDREVAGSCDYETSVGHFAGRTTLTRNKQ